MCGTVLFIKLELATMAKWRWLAHVVELGGGSVVEGEADEAARVREESRCKTYVISLISVWLSTGGLE